MVERYSDIRTMGNVLWHKFMGTDELSPEDELIRLKQVRDGISSHDYLLMYYKTKYWKSIRREVVERDNGACVNCGSKIDLQVDHIYYAPIGKERIKYLQTLCVFCHANKSRKFNILDNYKHKSVKIDPNTPMFTVMR